MTDTSNADDHPPSAPAQKTADATTAKDPAMNKKLAAGLVFGIGSAAVVAALLYTRKAKNKPKAPSVVPEPSD